MIIPYNKNITKLLNSQTIGINITLQYLLQSTKHTLRVINLQQTMSSSPQRQV